MKIGLMIYLVNDRETNGKRPYQSIRELAQQAEADGFDSIWLADHLMYRRPGAPTTGIRSWRRTGGRLIALTLPFAAG